MQYRGAISCSSDLIPTLPGVIVRSRLFNVGTPQYHIIKNTHDVSCRRDVHKCTNYTCVYLVHTRAHTLPTIHKPSLTNRNVSAERS